MSSDRLLHSGRFKKNANFHAKWNSWLTAWLNTLGQGFLEVNISSAGKGIPRILCNEKTHCHFTFMWPCIVTNFFIIKQTRCTNFPILLRHETIHVSSSSYAHHQEFSTVHSALVSFMQVWWPLPSTVRMELLSILTVPGSGHQTCMKSTSDECTVEDSWWWAEKMHETCRVLW